MDSNNGNNLMTTSKRAETDKLGNRFVKLLPRHKYLSVAQLVVLTAVLSYYLVKDVKEIIGYLRNRFRGPKAIKSD